MAVVALPLIAVEGFGAAAGGVVAGIAAAAGAYIDQRYIFPALFPPDDQVGPRLNDLRLSLAEEGASFYRVFGPAARVGGVLLWSSPNIETRNNHSSGKGGSGGNFVDYRYNAYLAIGFAARGDKQTSALQPSGIELIYLNGKNVWDRDPNVPFHNFQPLTAFRRTSQPWGNTFPVQYELEICSDVGDINLNELAIGRTVIVTGWTAPYSRNNSAHSTNPIRVFSTRYGVGADAGKTFATLYRDFIIGNGSADEFTSYTGGGGETINIDQSNLRFSLSIMSADPAFYDGTESQVPDSKIEEYTAAGNAPAFRGVAYAVLQNLNLQDFGNTLPTSAEAVVSGQGAMTVGECIQQICEERDIPAAQIDVSLCTDDLLGYAVLGPSSGVAMLQPLMLAYDIIPQMRGEVLHFFPRSLAPVVEIDADDLGAFEGGDEAPRNVSVSDADDLDMPTEVVVQYQDPERHYQTGAQTARISNRGARVQDVINLPVVLTSAQAREIAERSIRRARQASRRIAFSLPFKYAGVVRESTVCTFTAYGRDWRVLLDKVDRGENFILKCEGVDEDVRLATQFAEAEIGSGPEEFTGGVEGQGRAFAPGRVIFEILDNFCLSDEHAKEPGFYVVACMSQYGSAFKGAELYVSGDEGTTYSEIARIVRAGTLGIIEDIPSDTAIAGFWDDASVVVVELHDGQTLESVTDDQCVGGANRACIGNELIGFVNAEYLGDNRYSLTRLQRGLQGTEDEIDNHVEGERFALLTGPGVVFVPINVASIGTERLYKCVGSGARLEDCAAIPFTVTAGNVMPLAPVNVRAVRDGSNNATVYMDQRSRGVVSLLGTGSAPVYEPDDSFTVEIIDPGDPAAIVRTVRSTAGADLPAIAYTAAEQTADGYTPGDPIDVVVSQTSMFLGRGRSLAATV